MWYSSVVRCYLVWLAGWCWWSEDAGDWRLVVRVRASLGDSRAPQSSPLLSVRGQRRAASDNTTYQQSSYSQSRPPQHNCPGQHLDDKHSSNTLSLSQKYHKSSSLAPARPSQLVGGAVAPLLTMETSGRSPDLQPRPGLLST